MDWTHLLSLFAGFLLGCGSVWLVLRMCKKAEPEPLTNARLREFANLFHRLGMCPEGAETETHGPMDDELVDQKLPQDKRWRLLTREEVEAIK